MNSTFKNFGGGGNRKEPKFGSIYVYRKAGQKFLPLFLNRTPQVLQRGSVTIWGCMSYWGFGFLETFIGTMDSHHYADETLENYLRPSIDLLYPFGDYFPTRQCPTSHCKNHEAMACEQWYSCSGLAPIFSRFEPYRACVGTFEAKTLYFDAFNATRSYQHFFEPMERTTNSIC